MTAENVSAKLGVEDEDPSATVQYDFGDNLDGAIERFGADVVYSRFKAAAVVDLQALIRRHLDGETPKSETDIQALVSEWKPGVSSRKRRSLKEKAEELIATMSAADRAALLDQLMNAA